MVQILKLKDRFKDETALFSFSYTNPEICDIEHTHEFSELVIVDKGCAVQVINGQLHFIQEGDVFWVNSYDRHFYNELGTLKLMNILVNTQTPFTYLTQINKILNLLCITQNSEFIWLMPKDKEKCLELVEQMKQIYLTPMAISQELTTFKLEALFMELLSRVINSQHHIHKNSTHYKIRNLLRYLQQNYTHAIDWQWLSEHFFVSLQTMTRQIKELTGLSPVNYLNRLKVLAARERLHQTDDSITDIAGQCGFDSSDYFAKCYKKNFGVSPSKDRESNHQNSDPKNLL